MTDALAQTQIAREIDMLSAGLLRALKQDARAAQRGEATRTERATIEHLLPRATEFLTRVVATSADPRMGGKRPAWLPTLLSLDLQEVAAAALRVGFSAALRDRPMVKTLLDAGKALEALVIHTGLRKANLAKARRRALVALDKSKASPRDKRRALAALADDFAPWTPAEQVVMGAPLLSACIATGLFDRTSAFNGTAAVETWTLSDEGHAVTSEVTEIAALARPIYRPTLACPKPWGALQGGAYLTEAVQAHLPLVRTYDGSHQGLLRRGIKDKTMAPVLEAVSAIQSVPLRINQEVLALRTWAWDTSLSMPDVLPLRTPVALPVLPADLETLPAQQQRRLHRNLSRAKRINRGIGPNTLAFTMVTDEATELASTGTFFLPATLDFRGRVYPVPFLSHHARDATRALFQFAYGEPLGENGLLSTAVEFQASVAE